MTMTLPSPLLRRECAAIAPLDPAYLAKGQARLDNLTKPRGSLGRLEEVAARLYAVQETFPLRPGPAAMFTIAGDHGVVDEGVASCPREVTRQMVLNFMNGGAAINVLCAAAGVDLFIVDAGMAEGVLPDHPRFIRAKVGPGTANMAQGPAMSVEDCAKALELGVGLAETARQNGARALGTGEMGIGNTTPSSALFCAYLGFSAAEMTGMGAGVPPAGLAHKTAVIEKALAANAQAVRGGDPVRILAALGGYEIAALAGLILGGAARRMAVAVDGFIATAAYTAARAINPLVRDYCFFSHGSAEAGHGKVLEKLGERPLLDLGMRLGEGTGAALGLFLLRAAADIFNDMATFESAGVAVPAGAHEHPLL